MVAGSSGASLISELAEVVEASAAPGEGRDVGAVVSVLMTNDLLKTCAPLRIGVGINTVILAQICTICAARLMRRFAAYGSGLAQVTSTLASD